MKLISNYQELIKNIEKVENYLTKDSVDEQAKIEDLIKKGICFIAYTINTEIRFAPSRFIGYVNNNLEKHKSREIDGRETNKAIIKILGKAPETNETFEDKYQDYCHNLGITPSAKGSFGVKRKYWDLNIIVDFDDNRIIEGGFPEGKIVERKHLIRERSSAVIKTAKINFKQKHGALFCQVCGFNFEEKYGEIGVDFIEGHHTIPVSEMLPDHKTSPDDIAMLCSNCHRMVHKKRPWPSMNELEKILRK